MRTRRLLSTRLARVAVAGVTHMARQDSQRQRARKPQKTDSRRVLSAVERIYEAAADEARCPDLAKDLAKFFDSSSCMVRFGQHRHRWQSSMPTVVGILSVTPNFDDAACASYASHYHFCNEWYERSWRLPAPYVVIGEELIETREILRTEWSDYLHATRTLHLLGAQFRRRFGRLHRNSSIRVRGFL